MWSWEALSSSSLWLLPSGVVTANQPCPLRPLNPMGGTANQSYENSVNEWRSKFKRRGWTLTAVIPDDDLTRCSDFLPQSRDVHARLRGDLEFTKTSQFAGLKCFVFPFSSSWKRSWRSQCWMKQVLGEFKQSDELLLWPRPDHFKRMFSWNAHTRTHTQTHAHARLSVYKLSKLMMQLQAWHDATRISRRGNEDGERSEMSDKVTAAPGGSEESSGGDSTGTKDKQGKKKGDGRWCKSGTVAEWGEWGWGEGVGEKWCPVRLKGSKKSHFRKALMSEKEEQFVADGWKSASTCKLHAVGAETMLAHLDERTRAAMGWGGGGEWAETKIAFFCNMKISLLWLASLQPDPQSAHAPTSFISRRNQALQELRLIRLQVCAVGWRWLFIYNYHYNYF